MKHRTHAKKNPLKTGLIAGFSVLLALVVLFWGFVAIINATVHLPVVDTPVEPEPDPLQTERDTVRALLAGYPLEAFNQLNERLLLTLLIEELEEPFDTVALGSSRVLQLDSTVADGGRFYNCGVSGGDYRDVMNTFYRFEKAGKLPQTVIIGLDAWLLNPSPDALTTRSDATLFAEFLTERLGYEEGWRPPGYVEAPPEEPAESDTTDDASADDSAASAGAADDTEAPASEAADAGAPGPLDLGLFAEKLAFLFGGDDAADSSASVSDSVSEAPAFDENLPLVQGDPASQYSEVKMPDGTAMYPLDYRQASTELVEQKAQAEARTFIRMDDYTQPDPQLCELFHRFVQYVQFCGVDVVFLMAPYHPIVYDYATEYADTYAGFFLTEPWYSWYAAQYDIPLYGSYNPYVAQCTGDDFYDGLHVKGEAIGRYFPGVKTIRAARTAGEGTGSPWVQTGLRIQYATAEQTVAARYGFEASETARQAADVVIDGTLCYVVERYAENGTRLARYAMDRREGVVYRLDTNVNAWVVDKRY